MNTIMNPSIYLNWWASLEFGERCRRLMDDRIKYPSHPPHAASRRAVSDDDIGQGEGCEGGKCRFR